MRLMGLTLVPSMKSGGEIASEIWTIFLDFGKILDIKVKVIGTLVIKCTIFCCILVPNMTSVGQIKL